MPVYEPSSLYMLWQDTSKADLEDKLGPAFAYFQKKYGARPIECFVPTSELASDGVTLNSVLITPTNGVQPGTYHVGPVPIKYFEKEINYG